MWWSRDTLLCSVMLQNVFMALFSLVESIVFVLIVVIVIVISVVVRLIQLLLCSHIPLSIKHQ